MRTPTVPKITRKGRKLTAEARREAAIRDAKKRWQDIRETLSSGAEDFSDTAEGRLTHARKAAEEQWGHARDAAAPRLGQLRRRAGEAFEDDLPRLREELAEMTGDLRRSATRVGLDLKDASRAEADRIIAAIRESADQARAEAEAKAQAERKRRVKALIGWTAFGLVAGAIIAKVLGDRADDDADEAWGGPSLEAPQPGGADEDRTDVADTEDALDDATTVGSPVVVPPTGSNGVEQRAW